MGRSRRLDGVVAGKREREKIKGRDDAGLGNWAAKIREVEMVSRRDRGEEGEGDAGVGEIGWENQRKGVEHGVKAGRGKIRCMKSRGRGYRSGRGDRGGSNGDSTLIQERGDERRREGRREELGGGIWKGKSGFAGKKGGRPKVDERSGGGNDRNWGKIGEGSHSWSWRMRSIGGRPAGGIRERMRKRENGKSGQRGGCAEGGRERDGGREAGERGI